MHDELIAAIDAQLATAQEKLGQVEALLREQGALRETIARLQTARRALAGTPKRERKATTLGGTETDAELADRLVGALEDGALAKVKDILLELDCTRQQLRRARTALGTRVESPKRGWWRLVQEEGEGQAVDGADTHA